MDAHLNTAPRPVNDKKSTLMTIEEAAQYLRFHPSTVYRLARLGKLPAVKVGKQWRLDRETLERWLRTTRDLTTGRLHGRTGAMSRAESVLLATAEVPDERDETDNGEPDSS